MASLVGLMFLLGTFLFGSLAVLTVIGRTVVRSDEMDHDAGSVFLGVGPVGFTSRFRWSEVIGIEETLSSNNKGKPSKQITLKRGRRRHSLRFDADRNAPPVCAACAEAIGGYTGLLSGHDCELVQRNDPNEAAAPSIRLMGSYLI